MRGVTQTVGAERLSHRDANTLPDTLMLDASLLRAMIGVVTAP